MPVLDDIPADDPIKMLIASNSGTGKTGALASLAEAGYNVYILDFDRGLRPLMVYTSPKGKKRIVVRSFTDTYALNNDVMRAKNPTALRQALLTLNDWREGEEPWAACKKTWGVPAQFGSNSVVVVDSLSFAGWAALSFALHKNNILTNPRQQDWGEGQNLLTGLIRNLMDKGFLTNVIVLSHVRYERTEKGAIVHGWPSALGEALGPEMPKHFSYMLGGRVSGTGAAVKYEITTKPSGYVDYKFPHPSVQPAYPVATGLREIFKLLRGTEPGDNNPLPVLKDVT
jgi:hypothetical protein